MKIGIIGSGDYKNKRIVIRTLELIISKKKDIVVSGRSPRNRKDNVDNWAELWALEYCDKPPIIHPPKIFIEKEFKARNRLIARDSYNVIAFIPKGLYKSGAWNTINRFSRKIEFSKDRLSIYDELGILWTEDEFPLWLKERVQMNNLISFI